jgi:hypothetical protein
VDSEIAVNIPTNVISDRTLFTLIKVCQETNELRTLVAKARGDTTCYRELLNRYRAQATSLGFAGHIQWAESMP